jgi:hypothetical protein
MMVNVKLRKKTKEDREDERALKRYYFLTSKDHARGAERQSDKMRT